MRDLQQIVKLGGIIDADMQKVFGDFTTIKNDSENLKSTFASCPEMVRRHEEADRFFAICKSHYQILADEYNELNFLVREAHHTIRSISVAAGKIQSAKGGR